MVEVDSFKKRHLIFCGNNVLLENSENLIKKLQEEIAFLREQLKNTDEVIHSLLQQLAKRNKFVVDCNHVSSHETLDKTHCSALCNHKQVQQNTTHEELLIGQWNRNLTADTVNGKKHQRNRETYSEQEKDKKLNKEQKQGKSVVILGESMVKYLSG